MQRSPPQPNYVVYGEAYSQGMFASRRQRRQGHSWSTQALPLCVASCWLTSSAIYQIFSILWKKHDVVRKTGSYVRSVVRKGPSHGHRKFCEVWTCRFWDMRPHHTTTVLRPFSGTTRVSRCQKRTSGLNGASKINRGRHTDNPAGRHSIQTKQCPPPSSPIFCTPDAFPAAQPTVSKQWRQLLRYANWQINIQTHWSQYFVPLLGAKY